MSHTPILVFCLGSRPLFPLGGGNVAALQHEGTVGSVRPGRSSRAEGRCSRAPLGSHRPSSRASGSAKAEARGAARGSRPPAGQSASLLLRGGRPEGGTRSLARAETAVAGVLGARSGDRQRRGQRPSRDSRAPGGRPRAQGGDLARQAGADRARHNPGEAQGSRPAGSWSLNAWAPGCCSAHRPPSFRVAPARVASQGRQPQLPADEEVGEGGWPGD